MGKNIKWSKELIIEIASAFSTRNEFKTKSPKAYGAAHRNNWFEEACAHKIGRAHV